MSTQTDPIELLRTLAPAVPNGHKETLKQAAELVKQLQAEHADLKSSLDRQPLPEAPASLTVKVVDPANQMEYLVTVREAHAGRMLIGHIPAISKALVDQGLVAFDAYVDKRRAERGEAGEQRSGGAGGQVQPSGAPPICPTHGKPMKQSQRGGWFCSAKLLENDGTGKPVYCKQKA